MRYLFLTSVGTALAYFGFLLGRARAVGTGDVVLFLGFCLDLAGVLGLLFGCFAEGYAAEHGLV